EGSCGPHEDEHPGDAGDPGEHHGFRLTITGKSSDSEVNPLMVGQFAHLPHVASQYSHWSRSVRSRISPTVVTVKPPGPSRSSANPSFRPRLAIGRGAGCCFGRASTHVFRWAPNGLSLGSHHAPPSW